MSVQMVFLQLQIRQHATVTILRATLLSAAAIVARNSTYTGNCTMTEFTTPSLLMIGQSTILTAPRSHQQLSFWWQLARVILLCSFQLHLDRLRQCRA